MTDKCNNDTVYLIIKTGEKSAGKRKQKTGKRKAAKKIYRAEIPVIEAV